MKILELNSQGTIAVVIPRDIATLLGWEKGQDVTVLPTEDVTTVKLVNTTKIRKGE